MRLALIIKKHARFRDLLSTILWILPGSRRELTDLFVELRHGRHIDHVPLARLVVSEREAVLLLDDRPITPLVLQVQVARVDVGPSFRHRAEGVGNIDAGQQGS